MERLNIQLSRHIQTTRRPRWVVWLLVLLFAVVICVTYWITTLWFTRDTIYEAAPANTIVALRFFTGGTKEEHISSFLKNIPLITNRSIVFDDLRPFLQGEFIVFLKKNGTRSIAIRSNKLLPQSLLDSGHISQQQIKKNIVLLSEQTEQVHNFSMRPKIIPAIPVPGKTWIGEIALDGQARRGWIFDTKKSVIFSLPERISHAKFLGVPDHTIAFLSSPTHSSAKTDPLLAPFLPLIDPIIGSDAKVYLNQLSDKVETVFVTHDEKGTGFFLTIKQSADDKKLDIRKLLQSISALNSPKIQKATLSDGSFIQELISDPDSVSVEQVTVLGSSLYRVETNHEMLLAGTMDNTSFILTNREDLLRFYKGQKQNKTKQSICGANRMGFSLEQMNDLAKSQAHSLQSSSFEQLNQRFSSIGIVSKMYSTDINICKI